MQVKALVEFLSGLEKNNQRSWFVWNKPAYDLLRAEFEELVTDLAARVAKFDRGLGPVDPKKAMFRIYRDTRFSKERLRTRRISARRYATVPSTGSSRAIISTSITKARSSQAAGSTARIRQSSPASAATSRRSPRR